MLTPKAHTPSPSPLLTAHFFPHGSPSPHLARLLPIPGELGVQTQPRGYTPDLRHPGASAAAQPDPLLTWGCAADQGHRCPEEAWLPQKFCLGLRGKQSHRVLCSVRAENRVWPSQPEVQARM